MRYRTTSNKARLITGLTEAGGSITYPLTLARDPVVALEAVTKRYIDGLFSNLNASNLTSGLISVSTLPVFTGDFSNQQGNNIFSLNGSSVIPGTYTKVTVNSKGIVTGGSALVETDIATFDFNKITSGRPTTLAGYGITDAVPNTGGILTGRLYSGATPFSDQHLITKAFVEQSTISNAIPTGGVIRRPENITPNGFLRLNGAQLSKTAYAALYAIVGDSNNIQIQPGVGQPWRQQYAFNTELSTDITGWTTSNSLPDILIDSHAVVTKNRIYLLGGYAYGSTSTVLTTTINADGSLNSWVTATSLPQPVEQGQAVITKNKLYLIGGINGSNVLNTVYSAAIKADGTLDNWSAETPLPQSLTHFQVVILKNRIYLIGGTPDISNVSTVLTTVYSAGIDTNGTIGTWANITDRALPVGLKHFQITVTKNRIYLFGGWNGSTVVDTVYTATIDQTGLISTWSNASTLPTPLSQTRLIASRNRVYLIGGYNPSGAYVSTVYNAPINQDGTLGSWVSGTSLPQKLNKTQAIIVKNRVYLLGGLNTTSVSTVYTAIISGGMNDYSAYYDGTISITTSDNFNLPDLTGKENPGSYSFIKY